MTSFDYSVQTIGKYPDSLKQYGWVLNHYGSESRGTRWTHCEGKYYFRTEQDLLMFLLRWGK